MFVGIEYREAVYLSCESRYSHHFRKKKKNSLTPCVSSRVSFSFLLPVIETSEILCDICSSVRIINYDPYDFSVDMSGKILNLFFFNLLPYSLKT